MEYHDLSVDELQDFKDYDAHDVVRRISDPATGLEAYVAVHNANLGPALGGCRMRVYDDAAHAIKDVLRLSRGMTYKNALARLPLGGGKSVILGDPYKDKTDALVKSMAKGIDSLSGHYITAEDSGMNENDMRTMSSETRYVVGISEEGNDLGGDPSPVTAYGVYKALKGSVKYKRGTDDLSGMTVSVQGLGAVGLHLSELLAKDGVQIIATDVREESIAKAKSLIPNIEIVEPDHIFSVNADVFAPCAMGAQLNDSTIPQLNVEIICGAANNQLAEARHEADLGAKGILYSPDYVVNAGGVIAVCYEYIERTKADNPFPHDLTRENMLAHVERIGETLNEIFDISEKQGIKPGQAADKLAESIFLSDTPQKTAMS